MRIARLDLVRYGRFTDQSLNFGTADPDAPDLHVIFGPNEAGKSTLLSGWLDLLYGIPTRTDMDFLHPYASMRLGAALEFGGARHIVTRIKKPRQSLLDADETPLPDTMLQQALFGLDRGAYASMFSLNRHTLEQGGESILASEGDLGRLLFQASAGLGDLNLRLAAMQEAGRSFLSASGRKGRLIELRAELKTLNDRIRELDVAAPEYARLVKARDTAQDSWIAARREADAAQTELSGIGRLEAALLTAQRLARLREEMSTARPLPEPPPGWTDEGQELDRAETRLVTRLDTLRAQTAKLERDLDDLPADPVAIGLGDAIAAAGDLKSGHDEALKDLPRRQVEQTQAEAEIATTLSSLGRANADPTTLIPGIGVTARLRELIETHSGVVTALRTAQDEHQLAADTALRTASGLSDAGGATGDTEPLARLVDVLRRDDPAGAVRRAAAALQDAQASLDRAVAALAPWPGDTDALARLTRPDPATIADLGRAIADVSARVARRTERLAERQRDLARTDRSAAPQSVARITPEAAAAARARREAAWAAHRGALDAVTADRFEDAMRLDDQATAAMADARAAADKAVEAARLRQMAKAAIEDATRSLEEARTEEKAQTARLDSMCRAFGFESAMDLAAFDRWLDRMETAQTALRTRDDAARAAGRADSAATEARSDLIHALRLAGAPVDETASLTLALEVAQAVLERVAERNALQRAHRDARRNLERRKAGLQEAEAAMTAWRADWQAACAGTWMADAPPGTGEMRAVLDGLDKLGRLLERREDLAHRIGRMQDNRRRFDEAVRDLASRLDLPADLPAPDLWRTIVERQTAARTRNMEIQQATDRLADARDRVAKSEAEMRGHASRVSEFARFFGTEGWAATRAALADATVQARQRAAIAELTRDLCLQLQCDTADEANAALKDMDHDTLKAQAAGLQADLALLRATQEDAHLAYRNAEAAVQAVGGDDDVARLQEAKATLLLDMADGARAHLRQNLGMLAVEAALRRYRDTHRSGMLERASRAFCVMSRGRYSGLAAQPEGTGEVLVALGADGGSKEAGHLSDGARAQLYLALRIAGFHEFTASHGPVPFIADDIMESFDDDRTAKTFGLLGEMSRRGQVIYLTHHRHICEIAAAACPDARIHTLPD